MSKKAVKQRIAVVDGILTCEYPSINKKLVVNLAEYPAGIYQACQAADHGMEQKFGDAKSGGTAAEKFAEVQKIHASLLEGEWIRTATPDLIPVTIAAVARIKGLVFNPQTLTLTDPSTRKSATPTGETVKVWSQKAKVRAMIKKIYAERAEKAALEAMEGEIEVDLA